jgi:hypothetical protein
MDNGKCHVGDALMYTEDNIPYTGRQVETVSTSHEAAQRISGRADSLREQVFSLIQEFEDGLTDSEIQQFLSMSGNTQRPRRRELQEAGRIQSAGNRVVNGYRCIVWKVA